MLSELLSSKQKSVVVNIFLAHPSRSFSFTEIKISTACTPKMLTETLKELINMGFVRIIPKGKIKYFKVDKGFALYPELIGMLRKTKKLPLDLLVKEFSKLSDAKLIILTGIFTGHPRIESDILIVGKVSERRLIKPIQLAEKFAEQEVNFTVMPVTEFDYRKIMSDRFIKNVLENSPVIVVDKTKNKSIIKLVQRTA